MRFEVVNVITPDNAPKICLLHSGWNDWWEFQTLYAVYFCDAEGTQTLIGNTKIAEFNMPSGQAIPAIPENFESLDDHFYSLGQSDDFYTNLNETGARSEILTALNDLALYPELLKRASEERAFRISLTRSVSETSILGDFNRIVNNAAPLSEYKFSYRGPKQLDPIYDPINLDFAVTPASMPPSNVHVLIGRNGVGKSFLLNAMSKSIAVNGSNPDETGIFLGPDETAAAPFTGVTTVSFSAFDKFDPLSQREVTAPGITYRYVGLKKIGKDSGEGLKDLSQLAREFSVSAKACRTDILLPRWQRALSILESDPIFKATQISRLAEVPDEDFAEIATRRFRPLSSGHKIVLLTVTKLVELVKDQMLVLLDEPEAHLHPPLLSAFVRALSDLLNYTNGVAIIATHSPVVLQEVPSSCTWVLERLGGRMDPVRPDSETFAENVGRLTHQVFGLEVEESGFFNLIRDAVYELDAGSSFEDVLAKFDGDVGSEGQILVRNLLINLTNHRDTP